MATEQKTSTRPRLTRAERIEQLRAQAQRLEGIEKQEARKRDTRQKIVIGSAVIAEVRENPAFQKELVEVLKKRVTRQIDAEAVSEWLSSI